MSNQLVWLITGTSSGIGRVMTLAALERGDKVIATTRSQSFHSIQDLKEKGANILELDVAASLETLKEVAKEAVKIHGRVDVVVNNAGFIVSGSFEETRFSGLLYVVIISANLLEFFEFSHQETLDQFNTNVFGALNVARVFLPYMRERKSGTIAFIGSCYGWRAVPFSGLYTTTKFALRGLSETLHEEIEPFGLRSICFDSGCFRTPVLDKRTKWQSRLPEYREHGEKANAELLSYSGYQKGDPVKGVNAIIDVVRDEGPAQGRKPPAVFSLGVDCYETVKGHCESTLERLEAWKDITLSTDY